MNGWKRGVGLGGLLLLPTLLAVLLANWFDSGPAARRQPTADLVPATPQAARAKLPAATHAAVQPATLSAASTEQPPAPTQHASFNEYEGAVEQRRQTRLEAAFAAGAPAPLWTAEVSAYAKDAVSQLENGGTVRSVECRSTLCRVLVDLAKVGGMSADEFAPMPDHDQRTFVTLNDTGGATLTYYLAPEGRRLKSITENQIK